MKISFFLNNRQVQIECSPLKTLLDILRHDFKLTGTKQGCNTGECNSCLVFLNDTLVNACLIPAFRLKEKKVVTIEGFVSTKKYMEIEKAFINSNILMCGFCAPGLIMATEDLLSNKADPGKKEIIDHLSGNFCLHSGYNQVIRGVMQAAELRKKKKNGKKTRRN